jgi:hypothetical protein
MKITETVNATNPVSMVMRTQKLVGKVIRLCGEKTSGKHRKNRDRRLPHGLSPLQSRFPTDLISV